MPRKEWDFFSKLKCIYVNRYVVSPSLPEKQAQSRLKSFCHALFKGLPVICPESYD